MNGDGIFPAIVLFIGVLFKTTLGQRNQYQIVPSQFDVATFLPPINKQYGRLQNIDPRRAFSLTEYDRQPNPEYFANRYNPYIQLRIDHNISEGYPLLKNIVSFLKHSTAFILTVFHLNDGERYNLLRQVADDFNAVIDSIQYHLERGMYYLSILYRNIEQLPVIGLGVKLIIHILKVLWFLPGPILSLVRNALSVSPVPTNPVVELPLPSN